jgi:hypothetical protein
MQQRGRKDALLQAGCEGIEERGRSIHSYNYTIDSYADACFAVLGRRQFRKDSQFFQRLKTALPIAHARAHSSVFKLLFVTERFAL